MSSLASYEERRRLLDGQILALSEAFGGRTISPKKILRDKVGTPEWQRVTTSMGYSPEVVSLPKPTIGRSEGRNTDLRRMAHERWFRLWPTIGGHDVSLLEALLMPTELADDALAVWNAIKFQEVIESQKVMQSVGAGTESILPYANSYD